MNRLKIMLSCLDMKTGVVTVEYDYHGEHYKRESFASYPDQVVATHVESTEELNFLAELHTYHNQKLITISMKKSVTMKLN